MKAAIVMIYGFGFGFFILFFRCDWLSLFHPAVLLLSSYWCCVGLLGQKACHLDDSGMCLVLILVMPSRYAVGGAVVLWLAQRTGKLNILGLWVADCCLPSHLAMLPSASA